MHYVGSVNMMVKGRVFTIPVAKVMYQNRDDARPAGGAVQLSDGSWQIILDGRLSEAASNAALESAMEELSRRFMRRVMN